MTGNERQQREAEFQQPEIDQEEIRQTAYFLWEQDNRPEGNDEYYWWAALEKIARQRSADAMIAKGPEGD